MEKKLYLTMRTIQTGKHRPMPKLVYPYHFFNFPLPTFKEKKNSIVESDNSNCLRVTVH